MSNEIPAIIVGNLTGDPELRFTQSGIAVANFTVAQTPRTKQGDDWIDGEPIFVRCSVWREVAENVAESLQKGQRVIVYGRLKTETYTPRDGGGDRLTVVCDVDEIGPTLRWATAKPVRAASAGQGGGQQTRGGQRSRPQNGSQGAGQDPWAVPQSDEPPF